MPEDTTEERQDRGAVERLELLKTDVLEHGATCAVVLAALRLARGPSDVAFVVTLRHLADTTGLPRTVVKRAVSRLKDARRLVAARFRLGAANAYKLRDAPYPGPTADTTEQSATTQPQLVGIALSAPYHRRCNAVQRLDALESLLEAVI